MAYTPVAQRLPQDTPVKGGYTPVAQRVEQVSQQETGFGFQFPSFQTAQSTQDVLLGESKTPQAIVGRVLRDIGQSTARNIASAGVTIASKIDKNVEPLKAEDMKSFLGQALVETIFGKGEDIKSIEQRIAEAEPKVKAWQEELQKTS